MATKLDYNHINDEHEKSYGHLKEHGGHHRMNSNHDQGDRHGYNPGAGNKD